MEDNFTSCHSKPSISFDERNIKAFVVNKIIHLQETNYNLSVGLTSV